MEKDKNKTKLTLIKNNSIIPLTSENNLQENTGKVGFIKHYRSIQEERLWQEGSLLDTKLYFLIRDEANWRANTWTYEGKLYSCLPGELVTSVAKLNKKLCSKRDNITDRKIRFSLQKLVSFGNILVETGYQTKIMITDKKYWQWNPEHGGWVLVGSNWLYFGAGTDEIETYFKNNKEMLTLLYSNNAIYMSRDLSRVLSRLPEAETPDVKGVTGFEDKKMSQHLSRHLSTIEEGLISKEEAEEIAKTMPTAAVDKQEKGKVENPSPDEMIVELYHKIRKEYHKKESNTSIKTDIDRLQKSERRSTIIADGFQTVGRKIRGWFEYTEDWKDENNYPFAAFCKQYASIREVQPERVSTGNCSECGVKLYEGDKHKCIHIVKCDDCNTMIRYIGKKRDDEILQAHIDERGCNRPES